MKLKNAAIAIPGLFITMLFTQSLFAMSLVDYCGMAQDATTENGRRVILYMNGTWQYKTTASGNATASAIETVRAYCTASSFRGRTPFVLNQEKVKPFMDDYYKGEPFVQQEVDILTDTEPVPAPNGYVIIEVNCTRKILDADVTVKRDYYLKKTQDGYRVDWEASVGYNPVSAAEFIIKKPTTPVQFRVLAQISDSYQDNRNPKQNYWCIELKIDDDKNEWVYVEKDAAMGLELYKTLQDGKSHKMILELKSNPDAKNGQHFLLSKVINPDGWLL